MSHPTDVVEPDVLRAQVAAIVDPTTRELIGAVVERALVGLEATRGLDILSLEREAPQRAPRELWSRLEPAVITIWTELEELRLEMAPLVDAFQTEHPEGGELAVPASEAASEPDLDLEPEPDAGPEATPVPVMTIADDDGAAPTASQRLGETAWTLSVVLASEVAGFRRLLPVLAARVDGASLVAALRRHLDHVHAALQAVLAGILTSLPGAPEASGQESQALYVARELRTQLFTLRDRVLELERELHTTPVPAWHPLLERLARQVDELVFSQAFAWMRAGDKRTFVNQKRALADLMALWSPLRAEPARRTVASLARYLEATEAINQRPCLVEHDRAALTRALAALEEDPAGPGLSRALPALSEANGRDTLLDRLLAEALDPTRPPPGAAIVVRVREVLGLLEGGATEAGREGGAD